MMRSFAPLDFPSGEGSDFAGIVAEIGPDVTHFKIGDEVVGHTDKRASHAEYVAVGEADLVLKPKAVSWEVAGSLFVAGATAYASVRAVGLKMADKVVVSGAAGGVGSIAVQLARLQDAEVYGIASESNDEWLRSKGVMPISYSGDVSANIQAVVPHPDAFIDTVGKGYVKLAINLGVKPERINTIVDFAAAQQYGVKTEGSSSVAATEVLKELLDKVADGSLEVPIAKTFRLEDVRDAYTFLETQHHRGKVVLLPGTQELA
jgi:NADPH:quinone reductase-like Zn-dependent oxidoreductase